MFVNGTRGGTRQALTVRESVLRVTSRKAIRQWFIGWVLGSARTSVENIRLKTGERNFGGPHQHFCYSAVPRETVAAKSLVKIGKRVASIHPYRVPVVVNIPLPRLVWVLLLR